MSEPTISNEQQLAIIAAQIGQWQAAQYDALIGHRVHTKLGSPPATLKSLTDRMAECERAIDELERIRAELTGETRSS